MISVIIPCYNLEKHISKCIDSILNQEYKNIEIIIVDDGSSDNSAKICEEYEKKYMKMIKVIKQENQGVSAARNNGLTKAKGEYVCFLDGDDYLGNECFKDVIEKFNNNKDLDICAYGFCDVHEDGSIDGQYELSRIYPKQPIKASEALLMKCKRKIWICTGSCVYKRSLLDINNIIYENGYKYGEDVNFINKCISYARQIDYIKKNHFYCLVRNGSATRSGLSPDYIHAAILNRNLYDDIKNRKNLSDEDRKIMLKACDIDYIHVTTAAAKNVVENLGVFSVAKSKKLYDKFNIQPQNIITKGLEDSISKSKLLEWKLLCKNKWLFFYTVKLYRKIKR